MNYTYKQIFIYDAFGFVSLQHLLQKILASGSPGSLLAHFVSKFDLIEYSLISLEKNEFSLSNSLAGESYSAICPV